MKALISIHTYYVSQRDAATLVGILEVLVFGFLVEKKSSLVCRLHARQSDAAVSKEQNSACCNYCLFSLLCATHHNEVGSVTCLRVCA